LQKDIEVDSFTNSCYQISGLLFDELSSDTTNGAARKNALASVPQRKWESTSLVSYQSAGKLLIIDQISQDTDQDRAIKIANDFADNGFTTTVLISGNNSDNQDPLITQKLSKENVSVIVDELNELSGYLGHFSVLLGFADKDNFDLVLDLGTPAYLQQEVLPPGYYAPGDDLEKLRSALQEIPQMIGEFGKPVYVKYQADICAHSNQGITGCVRCLDCCPAEAIQDKGKRIEVNTSLCLGCGSCTIACPTGALSYTYPTVQQWLIMVRDMLADYGKAGGLQPDLLIYDYKIENTLFDNAGSLPDNVIPVPVEEIGSVGMDAWLSALAYGAGSVTLLIGNEAPESILAGFRKHLAVAHSILKGMGYSNDRLRLLELNEDNTFLIINEEGQSFDNNPAAGFMPFEKFRTIRLALNHLYQHAPDPQELIVLTEGSSFGEVQVDKNTCTLCMSCVAICPVQALQHDAEQLKLSFLESNCIQCGLCLNTCPEGSITLASRYIYDDALASKPRLLNEDTSFCCIDCGKPFISQRMFDSITEKLAATGKWSVSDEVTPEWLQMCGDCRVKDGNQ
jgi:ferredoxin/microcompartment protein CcmK/EutM